MIRKMRIAWMDVLDDDDEKDANRRFRQVKRRPQQLSTMVGQQAKQPRELLRR